MITREAIGWRRSPPWRSMLKHPVAGIETIDAASDGNEPSNNGSVARCDRVVTNINDQDRRNVEIHRHPVALVLRVSSE
jgi:hypothetical protein